MHLKHLSYRTEQTYLHTIKRFILFHGKRHPTKLGVPELRAYLAYLAIERNLAASTQNTALSVLLFLYREVLHQELPSIDGIERARRSTRLPVVFTREETQAMLAELSGTYHLMASLLYAARLRLTECLRLRVKDLDFAVCQITVRARRRHLLPVRVGGAERADGVEQRVRCCSASLSSLVGSGQASLWSLIKGEQSEAVDMSASARLASPAKITSQLPRNSCHNDKIPLSASWSVWMGTGMASIERRRSRGTCRV